MPEPSNLPSIRLSTGTEQDLGRLIQHKEHISNIVIAAIGEQPAANIRGFSARLASKISLETELVDEVITALWNIKNVQRNLGVNSETIIKVLTKSLQRSASEEWQSEYLDAWKESADEIAHALDSLTDDHAIFISAKANSLAYTQQNLMVNARIITDVRPVFDTAGENILETVITHMLALRYADGSRERRLITFALDNEDLASLRRQCERAERKSQVTVEALKEFNPVILPGNFTEE